MTKKWYLSKGMWAGILTAVFGVYSLIQASIPSINLPSIVQYTPILFTLLGFLGIYGRVAADGKIVFSDTK